MPNTDTPSARLRSIQAYVQRDDSTNYGYYGSTAPWLKNRLFWSRFKTAIRMVERAAGNIGRGALMDLGCQFAFVSAALSPWFKTTYLVELSADLLALGQGLHQKFAQNRVIPILNSDSDPGAYTRQIKPGERIDLFLLFDVLEHMPALDEFLASMRQVSSSPAYAVISLPTENLLYMALTRFKREPDHVNRYREIEKKLHQAKIVLIKRKSLLGLFNLYLYRL